MRRLGSALISWLLPAVLLTACAAGQAPSDPAPPDPAPSPPPSLEPAPAATPAPERPDAAVAECGPEADAVGLPRGRFEFKAVTQGLCTAVAPAEEFYVAFDFPPGLPEDVIRSALEVSGGEVAQVDLHGGQMLVLHLGPAAPGTETVVRVRGPVGERGAEADLGFRFRREASPTVTVEVQEQGGGWRPHEPGEYVPREPLRLRLTFSHPVAADQVEWRFTTALEARKDRAAIPHKLEWTDSRTLVVDLPEPPPALFVPLSGIGDERGLQTRGGILNLHAGTPPRLVALDPANGREEDLGPAPIDIMSTAVSPDGRWVVLEATRPSDTSGLDVWLVDTASGKAVKTDLAASPYSPGYYWLPDRLVVAGWTELQEWDLTRQERRVLPAQASYAGPLSPDGRYLAGRVLHTDREDPETWLAPLTVAVYDLATQSERLYPEVGNFRVPHRSGSVPIRVPMRWGNDGRSLYVLQDAEGSTPSDPQTYWAVLDLETGVLTPAEEVPEEPPYGSEQVTSASGWTFRSTGWGSVTLISPDGQEVLRGEGLPLAWMPDGRLLLVRWPDYAWLRHPDV